MTSVGVVLEWVQNAAYLLVGLWALRRWRSDRREQTRWLAVTFLSLALVVLIGVITRTAPDATWSVVLGRINLMLLLPFPWFLLRFNHTFEPVPRWLRRSVGGSVVVQLAVAQFVPGVVDPSAVRSPATTTFVLLVVATWTIALAVVAVRFWTAGARQPTIVRRRVRTLAVATLSLSLALIGAAAATPGEVTAVSLAVQVAAVVSSGLFLLGFAPPRVVKLAWRHHEEQQLHEASVQLMAAESPQEVGDLMAPHLRRVVAADAVVLEHHGGVLSSAGATPTQLAGVGSPDSGVTTRLPLATGAIHLWGNSYVPFFGDEELELLDRLALLTNLALDRTELLVSEREARVELEAANAELEAFVYSASHDLKSPLIALQSYTDVLEDEYGALLDDDGRWYLHRMRSNAEYASALVGDLLELSRVGRVDTTADDVPMTQLAEEVATEVRHAHPTVEVAVSDLPVVRANELRMRQLLRNLVENAATHGDGDGVRIEVDAVPSERTPGGMVVRVRDDGPGIPSEHRERVFGVFERLDVATESSGTGIGLAICRKIAESNGGDIWITDHAPGAEFAVDFPPTVLAPGHAGDRRTEVRA